MMAPSTGDDTEMMRTSAAPTQSPLAWSSEEETEDFADADRAPRLSRQHRKLLRWLRPDDEVWTDEDDAAYARGTVKIFVALMAVVIAAAAWLAIVWVRHEHHDAAQPSAPAVVAPPSPDDAVVPSTTREPPPPRSLDEQYLAALRGDGITSAQGESGALGMAHAVCRAIDRGETRANVTAEVLQQNPALQAEGAGFIVDTAIHFYCPPPGGQQ